MEREINDYQLGFIDGLEWALNMTHLPMEDLRELLKGKLDEIESEL